jgi:hypothetical protein
VGGEAVAPVAARVGLGTALTAVVFFAVFVARLAPVAGSPILVLLVVTALFLALLTWRRCVYVVIRISPSAPDCIRSG